MHHRWTFKICTLPCASIILESSTSQLGTLNQKQDSIFIKKKKSLSLICRIKKDENITVSRETKKLDVAKNDVVAAAMVFFFLRLCLCEAENRSMVLRENVDDDDDEVERTCTLYFGFWSPICCVFLKWPHIYVLTN